MSASFIELESASPSRILTPLEEVPGSYRALGSLVFCVCQFLPQQLELQEGRTLKIPRPSAEGGDDGMHSLGAHPGHLPLWEDTWALGGGIRLHVKAGLSWTAGLLPTPRA